MPDHIYCFHYSECQESPITQETNCTAYSSTSVRIQKMSKNSMPNVSYMKQEEICTVGKRWHHVFIKVIMVIYKYYYFDCNDTGMEYIEIEGTHAVGKCLRYAFIKIYSY